MIPFIDVILIIILAAFLFWGAFSGIANMIGNILGFIFGIFIASRYYVVLSGLIALVLTKANTQLLNIVSFIILLALVGKLVGFVVNIIFKVISFIPFVKTTNRLIGAGVGLIGGIIVTGSIVYMMSRYPITDSIKNALEVSILAPTLLTIFKPLTILLPKILKELKSLI